MFVLLLFHHIILIFFSNILIEIAWKSTDGMKRRMMARQLESVHGIRLTISCLTFISIHVHVQRVPKKKIDFHLDYKLCIRLSWAIEKCKKRNVWNSYSRWNAAIRCPIWSMWMLYVIEISKCFSFFLEGRISGKQSEKKVDWKKFKCKYERKKGKNKIKNSWEKVFVCVCQRAVCIHIFFRLFVYLLLYI